MDDNEPRVAADAPEGRTATQRHKARPEEQANRNMWCAIGTNAKPCTSVGRTPCSSVDWALPDAWLESSSARRDLLQSRHNGSQHPVLYQEERRQQIEGRAWSPLFSMF